MHWNNTAFSTVAFQVGACNTPDGAFRKLYVELESRVRAWDEATVGLKRNQATRLRLEAKQGISRLWRIKAATLELEADLEELTNREAITTAAMEGCAAEMNFLKELMAFLEPQCRFVGHMPLDQAFQLCESDEWRLEFLKRTENFLLTTNTIPTDHFEAMRGHPAFATEILPAIEEMRMAMIDNRKGLHNLDLQSPPFIGPLIERYQSLLAGQTPPALALPAGAVP